MPDYLISLAIGPVQGFIAAARRTRDLWFGSEVLSKVSKAAAKALYQEKAQLVFPAPQSPTELDPISGLNVGNKLMAIVNTDNPRKIIETAKTAARDSWRAIAQDALQKIAAVSHDAIRHELWNQQLDDVLELYGAWVGIQANGSNYRQARNQLERLLGARKTTRDFHPAAIAFDKEPGFGLPKSSLDAARETVLTSALTPKMRRKLGLSKGEQLDCPGVVKRLGGNPEQFPPITRIALEPWLATIPEDLLREVNAVYQPLVNLDLATRVRPERYAQLPFDGALLFPARIEAQKKELQEDETAAEAALNAFKGVRDLIYTRCGEPTPYFAVLMADGDHMGVFIDDHDTQRAHLDITRALAGFAGQAKTIMEAHQGACVYAGGDDVLALLPIHRAVPCAQALSEAFNATVSALPPAAHGQPSLSVGLGLGHVLTPFARLLDLGRRAERLAKDGLEGTPTALQRNALALIVGVRSGAEIGVRGQWNSGMDQRLNLWMTYYRENRLSDKTPYDLRQAGGRIVWAKNRADYNAIASKEAGRVLSKKRAQAGEQELSTEVRERIKTEISAQGLAQINAELLVARWLSEKAKE